MEPILNRNAAQHGYSPGQLRNPAMIRPVNGVSMLRAQADDLAACCRAIGLILAPDAVFTHLTSARLRGWWLPLLDDLPVIACTDRDAAHHDRRGVYVRRCAIPAGHREELDGIPVASAEWTIVELAEQLNLIDLVVIIDSALHFGHTTLDRILETMRPGRRGVRVLRRALALADDRSESQWETILRLLHQLCGIAVEPQVLIANAAGVVVARADLRIRGTDRLPEYDGADHRARDQHRRDLRREKALARMSCERYGYTAVEILRSPETVIGDAEDALGLTHNPQRLAAWRHEVGLSSLSARGLRALNDRMARFVRSSSPRRARSSGAKQAHSGADRLNPAS